MTDAELWLRRTDPLALLALRYPMRSHGSAQPQSRQSRLYLLACARKLWPRLPAVCRTIVGLAEEYADAPRERADIGAAVAPVAEQLMYSAGDPDALRIAELELMTADLWSDPDRAGRVADLLPGAPRGASFSAEEWRGISALLYLPFEPKTPAYTWVPREFHDVDLLRDVHGNPFRRVAFVAEWRTDTVLSLARQMYESREFSAMPILADALQDAGCNSDELLTHCRSGRPHARGCWVLDLVLEK